MIGVDGCVYRVDASGERTAVEDPGITVRETDTIVTEKGANAIIRFDDGVLTVLGEQSRLRVEKTRWLSHLGGTVYFAFRKVFGGTRQVDTRFATLGIRGTTFIVYDDEDGQGVALDEGVLDIASQGEAFAIQRQQQLEEFETFKQRIQQQQKELHGEFDEYKDKLTREFIEYREAFTLQPDHVVSFDGNRVTETLIDQNIHADFDRFEAIAGEMLEQFRERAQRHPSGPCG